ncbi:MAG: hypothetical protein HOI35_15665 [Woeseia sp.]|jgi:signal transduction histidine kinase|nr:hypothetical protein [Woeseia sp.]MBT6211440.1 hypothetical protein [Woeseia sp.]
MTGLAIATNTLVVASNECKYVATVSTDYDETLPAVPCHPQEFSQAILNMIVNSAHAISEKNDGETAKLGSITVTTRSNKTDAEIVVTDNGGGMPNEIRSKVFDPFFTTKGVGKGTGQGLSMAYATIVDKHGGQLRVESELGKGTTFTIHIPLESARTALTSDIQV